MLFEILLVGIGTVLVLGAGKMLTSFRKPYDPTRHYWVSALACLQLASGVALAIAYFLPWNSDIKGSGINALLFLLISPPLFGCFALPPLLSIAILRTKSPGLRALLSTLLLAGSVSAFIAISFMHMGSHSSAEIGWWVARSSVFALAIASLAQILLAVFGERNTREDFGSITVSITIIAAALALGGISELYAYAISKSDEVHVDESRYATGAVQSPTDIEVAPSPCQRRDEPAHSMRIGPYGGRLPLCDE